MRPAQLHKVVLFDHDDAVVDSESIALKSVWRLTAEVAAGIPQIIGYIGRTHINESERSSRASALRSTGAQHIIEQIPDLMGLLSEAT